MTGRFNLSALAVRERAITLFLIIALAASGIYSFVKLGRAEDPAFTVKVLTVTAMWPGATRPGNAGSGGRAHGKAHAGTALV